MGLDSVELVMAYEEGFGVSISDADAEACVTPSMVIDLVFSKLQFTEERICQTQRAFYLLRQGLKDVLGLERSKVKPDTCLKPFLDGHCQREVWERLRDHVQARSWPSLARPSWLTAILWSCVLGIFGAMLWLMISRSGGAVAFVLGGGWTRVVIAAIISLFVGVLLMGTTRPFKVCIHPRYLRLRELIPFAITSDFIRWTRPQVAELVRKITIEQLDLREGEYREDAHFVRDLRLDQ